MNKRIAKEFGWMSMPGVRLCGMKKLRGMKRLDRRSRLGPPPVIEHPPRLVQIGSWRGRRRWMVMSSEHLYDLGPVEPDEGMKAAWKQIIAEGSGTEDDYLYQLGAGVFCGMPRRFYEEERQHIFQGLTPPADVAAQFQAWPPTLPPGVARLLKDS